MKSPKNRRAFVVGYAAATPLGKDLASTWHNAVLGTAGFRKITRCQVESACDVVGEIPDWDPLALDFVSAKDLSNWNAAFVLLTMAVCKDALENSGIEITSDLAGRSACLIGSALNGHDAYRQAVCGLAAGGPNKVSAFLLPNLCGNLPAGKAGMLLGLQGLNFSPQGACASGNHAIGLGARLIRDGDLDVVLAGGVDTPILPEIVHGFANMNATIKIKPSDRAFSNPCLASRPFSIDRKGFVLSEGAGVVVLAAEDLVRTFGLRARAEVLGVGWTSDAFHFTKPNPPTIIRAMREALDDAQVKPCDVDYINAHGTSTPKGDATEVACLREVFAGRLSKIPITSNKSQLGHTLGACAAIEAALTIESMQKGVLLPTVNYRFDPELGEIDVVANQARNATVELAMSNAFGFGGTNCCIVFRGV